MRASSPCYPRAHEGRRRSRAGGTMPLALEHGPRRREGITVGSEESKVIVQRLYDNLFNRVHLALADELIAADCVYHAAPPGTPGGPDGIRRLITLWRASVADHRHIIEDLIAEDDKVAVRLTLSGTRTGRSGNSPLAGRRVIQAQVHILRLAGGQIAEYWAVPDDLSLLRWLDE
jgi:predicted ester cyclase